MDLRALQRISHEVCGECGGYAVSNLAAELHERGSALHIILLAVAALARYNLRSSDTPEAAAAFGDRIEAAIKKAVEVIRAG